jgi:hypothetical protein
MTHIAGEPHRRCDPQPNSSRGCSCTTTENATVYIVPADPVQVRCRSGCLFVTTTFAYLRHERVVSGASNRPQLHAALPAVSSVVRFFEMTANRSSIMNDSSSCVKCYYKP